MKPKVLMKCQNCGALQTQSLDSTVRAKAIDLLLKRIRHERNMTIRDCRHLLFGRYGLDFETVDALIKEMIELGMIKARKPGIFEVC